MKIPPRFEEYLKRKYVKICGSTVNNAKVEQMAQFFGFLSFEEVFFSLARSLSETCISYGDKKNPNSLITISSRAIFPSSR